VRGHRDDNDLKKLLTFADLGEFRRIPEENKYGVPGFTRLLLKSPAGVKCSGTPVG